MANDRAYKEKDKRTGNWCVRIRWASGKREFVKGGLSSKSDAQAFVDLKNKELLNKELGIVNCDLEDQVVADEFLEHKETDGEEKVCAKRLNFYEYAMQDLVRFANQRGKRILKFDKDDLKEYRKYIINSKLAPDSKSSRVAMIKCFFKWCASKGYMNPDTAILKVPDRENVKRGYNDDQIAALEAHCQDAEYRLMMRFGYLAGMREGEIARIHTDDFTLIDGNYYLRTWSIKGKTKKKKYRTIRLDEGIVQLLSLPDKSGLLFERWNEDLICHMFARLKKAAGIEKRVEEGRKIGQGFYALRHTFARIYLTRGGTLKDLKDILGHSSLDMIDKVYGHMEIAYIQGTMNKMKGYTWQLLDKVGQIRQTLANIENNDKQVVNLKDVKITDDKMGLSIV